MTPALRLDGIVKRFGATVALDGAELTVAPGEVHALLGENGAGKSTLLSILGGLQRPDAGRMELEGRAYVPRSPRDGRDHGIALIHQELSLFPPPLRGRERARGHRAEEERALRHQDRPRAHTPGSGGVRPSRHRSRGEGLQPQSIAAQQVVEICRAIALNARVGPHGRAHLPASSGTTWSASSASSGVCPNRGWPWSTSATSWRRPGRWRRHGTVLRDGKTVGTGRLDDVSNEDLIGHMCRATCGHPLPRTGQDDVRRDLPGRQGPGPAPPPSTTRRSASARGEVLGHLRAHGVGTDGDGASALRPRTRPPPVGSRSGALRRRPGPAVGAPGLRSSGT